MPDHMDNWTPKPGELVEYNGAWYVVIERTVHDDNGYAVGKAPCIDTGYCWDDPDEEWTPLLPAVTTPDEAWEALKGLPNCTVFSNYQMSVECMVETPACGQPRIMIHRTPKGIQAGTCLAYASPSHDASNDACRQMLGAIREWLKQAQG